MSAGTHPLKAQSAAAPPADAACKVCGGPSPLFGVVDFHKSCMEARGLRLALSGVPVYYRRCVQCEFAFTRAFDAWSHEEFARRIYNRQYVQVDPDYAELRPAANARLIIDSFAAARESIRILDYGGGQGLLAKRLRESGYSAETYDPFPSFDAPPPERLQDRFEHRFERSFDLITCFEVMEHLPDPRATVAELARLVKRAARDEQDSSDGPPSGSSDPSGLDDPDDSDEDDGMILFSTLLQPADFEKAGLAWWYAAPRNGHISLYTAAALARLFGKHGMRVASYSSDLHIAFRRVPGFAAHLGLALEMGPSPSLETANNV